jgi:CheY-like chemotaxis protein
LPSERRSAVILVVERDPHVRELEAFFLDRAGFAVDFARDGHEALELIASLKPDVVISEVLVPRLDGLALCRRIKANPETAGTKVLIFSILAAAGRAKDAGADAFLMKPLAEQKLVETVQALITLEAETPS